MKVIFSGKANEFSSKLEDKLRAKLSKLGKLIERRGEREAHVCHHVERHLHRIEIVVNVYDHALKGEGVNADMETALHQAVERLEAQVVKLRARWRDTHRDKKHVRSAKEDWETNAEGSEPVPVRAAALASRNGNPASARIFRVNYDEDRKPMTLEEAMLEMEKPMDYIVYRDSDRNCLSVLVRRRDGNFDLIES